MESLFIQFFLIHLEAWLTFKNYEIQHSFIEFITLANDQRVVSMSPVQDRFHIKTLIPVNIQNMAFFDVLKSRVLEDLYGFFLDEFPCFCHLVKLHYKITVLSEDRDLEIGVGLYVIIVFYISGYIQYVKCARLIIPDDLL